MTYLISKLSLEDSDTLARIHRSAFDDRLPWLAGRHTPEEDQWFIRERVFPICDIWGACVGPTIEGFIAFREHWIDHLYVLPEAQGRGLGSALLEQARSAFPHLSLWTFQRNRQARAFYEAKGFLLVEETDGSDNEEHEPDVLYTWMRRTGSGAHELEQRGRTV
jgi:putative acetyltransferase